MRDDDDYNDTSPAIGDKGLLDSRHPRPYAETRISRVYKHTREQSRRLVKPYKWLACCRTTGIRLYGKAITNGLAI